MGKTKYAGNASLPMTSIIFSRTLWGLFFMPLFHTDSQVSLSLGIIHYCVEGFTFAIKLIVAGLHFLFLIDLMFTKWVKITVKTMS